LSLAFAAVNWLAYGSDESCPKANKGRVGWLYPHTALLTDSRPLFFLLGLDFNDLGTLVGAAIRADVMRPVHLVALWAGNKLLWCQREMGATAVARALGGLSLW